MGINNNENEETRMKLLQQIEAAFAESDAQSIANIPAQVEQMNKFYDDRKAELEGQVDLNRVDKMIVVRQRLIREFSLQLYTEKQHGLSYQIEQTEKRTRNTHKARNNRIAAKMEKAGITSIDVDNFKVVYGKNFEGHWIIDGFRVKIEVIFAGGYNIQCLHHRVLVNIKRIKAAA